MNNEEIEKVCRNLRKYYRRQIAGLIWYNISSINHLGIKYGFYLTNPQNLMVYEDIKRVVYRKGIMSHYKLMHEMNDLNNLYEKQNKLMRKK